ncbi:methionyl-tRNA formyltransferase [Brucella intermedia]|uniref:methionyl-tRNA formyltransferase n=1 Tax=Brucella intermedia TaxID=94625 RepID=UPI00158A1B2C|nr:methionyl-tRNA formyltransferase [Brucella intermedia]NYD80941.1 hypothetical protein [Brucella intermedia]
MARLVEFERGQLNRFQLHDPIDAKYYIHEVDGRKLFQLSTFGRSSREMPGKLSQTIQLDENAAKQLYDILKATFGF